MNIPAMDEDERKAHFEDLERFLSYWSDNPEGFAHFVGWAIGRLIPHKFPDLFLAIGASYFSLKYICSRIDFLYDKIVDTEELSIKDGRAKVPIATVYKQEGILCIHSPKGRMMILRDELDGLPYYSIRYFVNEGEKPVGYLKEHWNKEWGRPTFANVMAVSSGTSSPEFEEDYTFWNFRDTDDVMHGVIVYPHSDGFVDLWETKRLAELVILVSNLKNFDRRLA